MFLMYSKTRGILCALIFLIGSAAMQVNAQSVFEGTWEATMTRVSGPGLQEKAHPPQVWRMAIQGSTARMFIRRESGQFEEIKPGIFRFAHHMTNGLVYSLDSARDGSWVETESWVFIQKNSNTLGVVFSGSVKNPKTSNLEILHYLTVRTGEFRRLK